MILLFKWYDSKHDNHYNPSNELRKILPDKSVPCIELLNRGLSLLFVWQNKIASSSSSS